MKKPVEMTEAYAIELHDGRVATTLDVWEILNASFRNDFDSVKQLAERNPGLLTCQFDYTSPLHFAVREGHFDLVRFFVDAGALDPGYSVHPFMDPLLMIAEERGLNDTAVLLKQSLEDPTKTFEWGDTGKVDFARDETRVRFEQAVDQGNFSETKAMLEERPDLALDKLAFWGEAYWRCLQRIIIGRCWNCCLNTEPRFPKCPNGVLDIISNIMRLPHFYWKTE